MSDEDFDRAMGPPVASLPRSRRPAEDPHVGDRRPPRARHPRLRVGRLGFKQFVALIAALMAVNALAIDSMLPALPAIGHALGVEDENRRQWIVTAYLLGFGGAQIVYGPLSDRLGRRPCCSAASPATRASRCWRRCRPPSRRCWRRAR